MSALHPSGPHGGDGARLAMLLGIQPGEVLDLSASLNPAAPDLRPILSAHLDSVRRYPDPAPATKALATLIGVNPDRLVITNGGAEAIALIAAELQRGWVEEPEFSLYARHLQELDPGAGAWRSNPRNPTGKLAPIDQTARVWDEAFWPLATGSWTRGDADHGAVVVGSLTKLLACPGLRVGYTICPTAELAERVRRRQPQWAVNGLVADALPELLDLVDLAKWAVEIRVLRSELIHVLRDAGYQPQESDANWVLVHAPDLREQLAAQGIAIRDCGSFGMPGTVRIAVPDEAGLARLEAALPPLDTALAGLSAALTRLDTATPQRAPW